MRKEIEVKAKVADISMLERALEKMGCAISAPVTQNDETFVDATYGEYSGFHLGKNILRIRETNGRFLFTIKQPQKNELDAIEYESEISDPQAFRNALLLMGYIPAVRIQKTRRRAHYGELEICLDHVTNLGAFIEVEKISEDEDAEKVQDELFTFLEQLGVVKTDRVFRGYDTLIYMQSKENGK